MTLEDLAKEIRDLRSELAQARRDADMRAARLRRDALSALIGATAGSGATGLPFFMDWLTQ